MRAYRHLDRLRAPERLREWLCSIALNAARTQAASEVRWSRAQQDFAADARDVHGDDMAEPLLRELRIEAVREAIESVSDERQRLLLTRYYTDEREPTTREMAQELGLPASTVTVTLMRARARIARRVFTALAALEEARP